MTSPTIIFPAETQIAAPARRSTPNFFRAWTSSFLLYFYPNKTAPFWVAISLPRAALIALINLLIALPWMLLLLACNDAWSNAALRLKANVAAPYVNHPLDAFLALFPVNLAALASFWKTLEFPEKCSAIALPLILLLALFAIAFFILIPFAARPGSNKSCIKHVIRTLLLSTGIIHIAAPILSAAFILFIAWRYPQHYEDILGPLCLVCFLLLLWTFLALVKAAAADYRAPADFPQPRDPTCEHCGYDLIAADLHGRCPECGTLVAQSLGPDARPGTAWEANPSLFNFPAMLAQLRDLIRRPRNLFLRTPTLTGRPAARRWLLMSFTLLLLAASLIVPGFCIFHIAEIGWSRDILWSGLFMGIVWALLGLMMVGIETTGIATLSRMKGHPVPLAAAAKVTAYSSPLMLLWILLGGLQLLLALYAWDHHLYKPYSIRTEQIVLAVSMSIAHIGGLLWFELTVYRGIRSIQFANK